MKAGKLFTACSLLISVMSTGLQSSIVYAGAVSAQGNQAAEIAEIKGDYVENEIIVEFEKSVDEKEAEEISARLGGRKITAIDTFNEGFTGVVKLPTDKTVEEAAAAYGKDAGVAHVQPNYKYRIEESNVSQAQQGGVTAQSSGDTNLWHLERISALKAWSLVNSVKHTKTRVAVVDSGVDLTHPDLQANLNVGLCADVSTGKKTALTGDALGHGTHVAGIIAAAANNGIGVAGVASGSDNSCVELFAVKVTTGSGGECDTAFIMSGLKYAFDSGAKVINLSMRSVKPYDVEYAKAIDNIVASGTVIVCAAGNDYGRNPAYPSDFTSCISVIATDRENARAVFSNFGPSKNISAPGEEIISTYPVHMGAYRLDNGTSMASPIVAGVAALICAVNPNLSADEVRDILCSTAVDIGAKGYDIYTGHGLVNAEQAVRKAISTIGSSNKDDSDGFTVALTQKTNSSVTITVKTPLQYVKCWGYAFDTNKYAMREYFGNNTNRNINQYTVPLDNLLPNTTYYFRIYYVTNTGKAYSPGWQFTIHAKTKSSNALDPQLHTGQIELKQSEYGKEAK